MSLSENPKNPSCTVSLFKHEETELGNVQQVMHQLEHIKLNDIVNSVKICFDPDDLNTLIKTDVDILKQYREFSQVLEQCADTVLEADSKKSNWIMRIEMNNLEMLDKNISMDDINFALSYAYGTTINCIYSDYNSDNLIFRIRMNNVIQQAKKIDKSKIESLLKKRLFF